MERVGTLIHKLLEQYEQQAQAGRLLMTAQMLLAELQQQSYSADNSASEKVTVVIPSAPGPLNRVQQPGSNMVSSSEAGDASAAGTAGPVAGERTADHGAQISVLQGADFADPTVPVEQDAIHVEAPVGVPPVGDIAPSTPVPQQTAPIESVPPTPVPENVRPVTASEEVAPDPLAAFFPAAALWRQPVPPKPAEPQPGSQQTVAPKTEECDNAGSSDIHASNSSQVSGGQRPASNEGEGSQFSFDPLSEVPTLAQQQPKQSDFNDRLASVDSESLNEKLRVEQIELGSMLQGSPIRDLKKAIGINDRYLFINELFRGDETMYERSLKTINGFSILPEAQYWIQRELKVKLGWNESSESVHHFDQLVKRRFS